MSKRTILLLILGFVAISSKAQMPDSLFSKLGDFDLARFYDNVSGAIILGEKILPDTAKLPAKARISFFGHLAKIYEDNGQDTKAVFYYEKVATAVPDYYVVQRALGYLYNKTAETVQLKLFASSKDDPAYKQLFAAYKDAVLKALPHLEKAQACDPSDETLDLIKTLYKNIHDERGLNSINSRLPDLSKSCIDILSDH